MTNRKVRGGIAITMAFFFCSHGQLFLQRRAILLSYQCLKNFLRLCSKMDLRYTLPQQVSKTLFRWILRIILSASLLPVLVLSITTSFQIAIKRVIFNDISQVA